MKDNTRIHPKQYLHCDTGWIGWDNGSVHLHFVVYPNTNSNRIRANDGSLGMCAGHKYHLNIKRLVISPPPIPHHTASERVMWNCTSWTISRERSICEITSSQATTVCQGLSLLSKALTMLNMKSMVLRPHRAFLEGVPCCVCCIKYIVKLTKCGHKLLAEECLASGKEAECAFHISEAVSASLRTMAVYRDEQIKAANNKLLKITSFIKPVQDIIDGNPVSKHEEKLFDFLSRDTTDITKLFSHLDTAPFHKRYLRFSPENNVENLQKILRELPKEWSIVQLTAPYNPNENLKPQIEYKIEINSLYLTMYSNEYLDRTDFGPMTVNIPANVTKGQCLR
ncbi:hypothetical protein evm_009798 [Chilo suppressalis]|nr:hypothetical protein evm_009798 [Chilo suppressalis]